MKISEIIARTFGLRTLLESDEFVAEMANFLADVTELPANIVLWTKPQPEALPHDKYRIKVYRDRIHCATLSISDTPHVVWQITRNKFRLDASEADETIKVISLFSSLFIQYVDAKLTANQVKEEIKKVHGS